MADKKLKIIRIIARLNIGGPAIHTVLLSSELNKAGYADILVSGSVGEAEGDMSYLAKAKGLVPVAVPEMGREINLANDIRALFRLYSIIKKERPDIVHTHTAKAGTLGRIAALMAGVPIKVHTFHGHIFDGYFSPLKARIFLLIEKFLAIFSDRLITVSEAVREEIINKLRIAGPDKVIVLPLGLELGKFLNNGGLKGNFRKRIGVDNDVLLVGIVGRLVPIKNHKMFLDVARIVRTRSPHLKVKFVVVGDGEMRDELEKRARDMGMEGFVIFTGWIENVEEVYADLDIVALTSINEGTPVSLIEALAAEKAVVATDAGGVRDVVFDGLNGVLAKNRDAEDFFTKLIALLNDKERRSTLGGKGRVTVERQFAKERLVGDIESLYRDLAAGKSI